MASLPAAEAQRAPVRGDLLYVGSKYHIGIYTYPGGRHESRFAAQGRVEGMCSDVDGNVFVASLSGEGHGEITEYAHGGSVPVVSLRLPRHNVPTSCTSDPMTRNLAVPCFDARDNAPSVVIYAGARGRATTYRSDVLGAEPQAAYDDRGNLFATSGGNVAALLAAGARSFATITLRQTLGGVAHVQWDGAHLAVQSFAVSGHNREKIAERIFRLRIRGSMGTIVGSSRFEHWFAQRAGQSWIAGGALVATPRENVVFWKYPAGGDVVKNIRPGDGSIAVTVSAAP